MQTVEPAFFDSPLAAGESKINSHAVSKSAIPMHKTAALAGRRAELEHWRTERMAARK